MDTQQLTLEQFAGKSLTQLKKEIGNEICPYITGHLTALVMEVPHIIAEQEDGETSEGYVVTQMLKCFNYTLILEQEVLAIPTIDWFEYQVIISQLSDYASFKVDMGDKLVERWAILARDLHSFLVVANKPNVDSNPSERLLRAAFRSYIVCLLTLCQQLDLDVEYMKLNLEHNFQKIFLPHSPFDLIEG